MLPVSIELARLSGVVLGIALDWPPGGTQDDGSKLVSGSSPSHALVLSSFSLPFHGASLPAASRRPELQRQLSWRTQARSKE